MRKKTAWLRPPRNELKLSIITDPIPVGRYRITEELKGYLRKLRQILRNFFNPLPNFLVSQYRGHPAVTRSMVEGLNNINVQFNYNPRNLETLSQTVVVVSGIPALKQMIALKQRGYIRKLIVGPNILNDPSSNSEVLAAPEVDRYITHAPVCGLIVRFIPSLTMRCAAWAAGVDCSFWKPGESIKGSQILVYNKQNSDATASLTQYVDELKKKGYEVAILNYGSYSREEYREQLQKSRLMIGFSRDETQGIAWAEAWSCNVPTFFLQNNEPIYLGVKYEGSTAPYLTEATGKYFKDIDSFINLFEQWERNEFAFNPREWCLENMSDEVCANNLVEIIQSI